MRLSLIILLALLMGCKSYPRYAKQPPVTPEERVPTRERYSTRDYIRLGMILRAYLGKPYKGSSRYDAGVDCSMFIRDVYKEFNKTELPRTAEEQYKQGTEVPRNRLSFGDLVFFKTERKKKVSHVGIYAGHNEFMHASSSRGVIISGMGEEYWASRYVGARRILDE
ncbi:MAG: C40 family peptidase [Candidatus Zixiibacteriota bacterium]|nr:MAG: C40 family peptidase [candidate division Zixibacteria bacterium]